MSTRMEKSGATGSPQGILAPSGDGARSGFLSDVIVDLGFADREAVEQAVRTARSPGTTVARALVEVGAVTEEQLAMATAERYGIAYIDLDSYRIDVGAANLIKPTAAKRYQALPVGFLDGELLVAMADPADALGVNDIALMTKLEVCPAVASRPALEALLDSLPLDEHPSEEAEQKGPVTIRPPEPEIPAQPASSAVFWQDGGGEALPAAALAPEAGNADAGDGTRVLREKLVVAEAELEEARARVREVKGTGAELEALRDQLAEVQAQLEQAGERTRAGEAEMAELRAKVTALREERDGFRTAANEAERLRDRMDAVKAERDESRDKAREAESELRRARADTKVRAGEVESMRDKLSSVESDLVRARTDASASAAEVAVKRGRAAALETNIEELRERLADAEREAAANTGLAEELASAEARSDEARQAMTDLRAELEREQEQWAVSERDLRAQLGSEEERRGALEERLSEVKGAAFAAERAFEELREAQRRMRGALRALAEPDAEPDKA